MEIDYDYLRTGTAIGFRASRELCSNYLFCLVAVSKLPAPELVEPSAGVAYDVDAGERRELDLGSSERSRHDVWQRV